MLPEGFSNLVAITINNWDWDVLPTTDSEVWDALLYPVFLGATVRSAQAYYVKVVLEPYITMDAASAVRTDAHWSENVINHINRELNNISGTPGKGYKQAILTTVTQSVQSLELSRTLDTALSFFNQFQIGVSTIYRIRDDDTLTRELVDYATRSIYNVSYIKSVLWLYACGIAYNLVPPNAHISRFLAECGDARFDWSRDVPEDWQIFALACNRMVEIATTVSRELNQQISAKKAQAAVWYYQTCRGLLPRQYARHLSPQSLVDFLHHQNWNISQLETRLLDVETLDELREDLTAFLQLTI